MNIFSSLRVYNTPWVTVSQRNFTSEEKSSVEEAVVVESEYGYSVCFKLSGGGQSYIPLSKDATLSLGDSVDMNKALLITLERNGEQINRVML